MDQGIPMLSEHQAVPSPEGQAKGAGYEPTPEETKTIKLGQRIFEKHKKWRSKYDGKWLHYYKMFRGKQWDKDARPSWKHTEVINMVFQSIQSTVPIMTDARPKPEFLPRDPADLEIAEILNDVFESDYDRNNWQEVLVENILESHLYSVGLGSVGYDPKANYGEGSISWDSEDPFYNYPDPNSYDCNKKSRAWVKAEPVDIDVIKVDYPDKGKYVKPDLEDYIKNSKTENDEYRFKSPVDNKTLIEGDDKPDAQMGNKVLKLTVWMKSDEFIEEEKSKTNDQGVEEKLYEQKLRWPNGRKIVIAGGVLLEDVDNFEDGLFPFARVVNYVLPREFYGISEVEQLESPQKIFNKLISFTLDVLTLMGNPVWIIDNNSDVDTDNLFNRPGMVLEPNPNTRVQRMEGVQLQPYVLQIIDRMREYFDGVSGNQEVSQGIKPEGVSAASAIMSLQEAAQTRTRLKSRNVDQYLQQIGTLWKNRAFEFYTAPRIVRVSGNPNAQRYFKFHIDKREGPEGPQDVAIVTQLGQNPETGAPVETGTKEYIINGEFDVKVSTGSALPFAKDQKFNKAMALFDRGALDELELLKDADYPNPEAVFERVQQRKAQQAEQAMMAKMAGGAAPGGQAPPPGAPPAA